MAIGRSQISSLDQLRGPMTEIMAVLSGAMQEVARYKAMYGDLASQ